MRRKPPSVLPNPVLVGAVTVLAVMLAVFLAYTANAGLPFVPTKELRVDVANGANLVVGSDVREGGYRIGLVSALAPIELANGRVGAQLTLQLNNANGSVPSRLDRVDPAAVGARVEVRRPAQGHLRDPDRGRRHAADLADKRAGAVRGRSSRRSIPRTRRAIQENLVGIGNALAGRGSALNDTIASLPALLGHLEPVARYLSAPSTELTRFLRSLNAFTGTVAPVAPVASRLFTDMATTFEAISRDPSALEASIAESPSTLAVGTDSLIVLAAVPRGPDDARTAADAGDRRARGDVAGAQPGDRGRHADARAHAGAQREPAAPAASRAALALAPGTNQALNGLTSTVGTLNPMVRYLGPFQTVCDDWNYWWTYLAEHLSARTKFGFAQRAMINLAPPSGGSVGQQGATTPVNGTSGQ